MSAAGLPQTAVLFPGQGSQTPDIRDVVARLRPDLLELAIEEVGTDPFERVDESTRFAQPAIYCASVALWSSAPLGDVRWMAGHSMGELAALVAAGSLDADDGLSLVALRGRLMADAAGDGTMLAIVGGNAERDAVAIAAESGTFVANLNAPGQAVLAGPEAAIEVAAGNARERGVRTLDVSVRGAFHTPAMEPAREPFAAALADVELRTPSVPVLSGMTGEPFRDLRRELVDALTNPVRWHAVVEWLAAAGARRFVEVGPGKVLTKLLRRTLRDVTATTLAELAHL